MEIARDKTLTRALVWFRRDLRVDDHPALAAATKAAAQVWCVFVLDTDILDALPRRDRRVEFIRECLVDLDDRLHALGSVHGHGDVHLIVKHGSAATEIPALAKALGVEAVFMHHDDDPSAVARDATVREALNERGVRLLSAKDHVVFERREILTGGGTPYGVFTPYKNAWLKAVTPAALHPHDSTSHTGSLAPRPAGWTSGWREGRAVPRLDEFGFETTDLSHLPLPAGVTGAEAMLEEFLARIDDYDRLRDFPGRKGPSYLGAHLRFGTLSIRRLARLALDRVQAGSTGAQTWLSELIWRDFYHQVLHHHPHVVKLAFRPEFDDVAWETGPQADAHFAAWCEGRTGYPIVDAGMRQLLRSGYMHNRLRMVTASFLTKDLGLDWRRGEAWFALHLNDFDLAANNGGWQWAASTGCDAQPWFRIFNPVTQSKRFDPLGAFIRRYVPEVAALPDKDIHAPWAAKPVVLAAAAFTPGIDYPLPIVDHDEARKRTLARFGARGSGQPVPSCDDSLDVP
jgi:deoxyribodipyrimidine photo-lyase